MNPEHNNELDDEGPQSVDLEELGDDGASDTLPCPLCGEEIYEGVDRCPLCGEYVVLGVARRPRGMLWRIVLILIGIALAIWIVRKVL